MALSARLLEKLACPNCRGELKYNEQEEKLNCATDQLSFRVVEDIPMLNLDQAEKND